MSIKDTNICQIPECVTFILKNSMLNIKGKFGSIDIIIPKGLRFVISKDNNLVIYYKTSISNNIKVITANIRNAMIGVSSLFQVRLSLVGVGYRFNLKDNILSMRIGYNHSVDITIKDNIICKTISPTSIILLGNNLQQLVLFASSIRNLKKPEVYKGKGIRFLTEVIKLKKAQVK
jgi:large subunit ribosomal protein L6